MSPFTALTVLVVGTSGFYYAFFAAMFLMLAAMGVSARLRSFVPVIGAVCISAVMVLLLLLSAYGTHVPELLTGGIPSQPSRPAWHQLYHGLLISNSLHVYRDIGIMRERFAAYMAIITTPIGMGVLVGEAYMNEWPGAFLTTIILAAPAAVVILGSVRSETPRMSLIYLCSGLITFGLIFAIRGGLGYAFGYFVTGAVRAQERILPFLTFYAIVIACMACAAPKLRSVRAALATVLAAVLALGCYPSRGILSVRQSAGRAPMADQLQSARAMLAAKEAASLTAILQLPVMPWPEAAMRGKMYGYMSMPLPYVLTDKLKQARRDGVTGLFEAQPEFKTLAALTTSDAGIVLGARKLGFDGILIEKSGYTPTELQSLTTALVADGACEKFNDQYRALYSACN